MNILYSEYLEIEGLKRGYEEQVFRIGLMQLHAHYCVAGGVRALPEEPQMRQALQRPSSVFEDFEVPQEFMRLKTLCLLRSHFPFT